MKKSYPLFKVHVDKKAALKELKSVFDSGFINEGQQVTELGNKLKPILNTEKFVLVNSCTSAIHLALHLSGVRHYDDVISTSMTCVATNTPIVSKDANIVWADIDMNTGCIDPDSVREMLKNYAPKAKAVVAVAWAGNPPALKELREICDEFKCKLILDAAHAFGATYENVEIHSLPDYTCYSLQAIKHVTTGDGGILVCKSDEDFSLAKQLKWFGIDRDQAKDDKGNWKGQHWDFDIKHAGYKFNMNNLSAAVGLSQLKHINKILDGHQKNAMHYSVLFEDNIYAKPLSYSNINATSSHWVYTVILNERYEDIRDELLKRLNDEGIGAGLVHVPNHWYSCFKKFERPLMNVLAFSQRQLSLPVGWWLKPSDIKHIYKRFDQICKELSTT